MLKLKNINFYLKNKKLDYILSYYLCDLTHLQDGKTKVKLILRILEKMHVGSDQLKSTGRIRNPDPKKTYRIHKLLK
jgi:hypothetical protein